MDRAKAYRFLPCLLCRWLVVSVLLTAVACAGGGSSGDEGGASGGTGERGAGDGADDNGGGGASGGTGTGTGTGAGTDANGTTGPAGPGTNEDGYRNTGSDKWQVMNSGTFNTLANVWGTAANSLYAVGIQGTLVHYDGQTWTPTTLDTELPFTDVWGSSDRDVYAVGLGKSYHYDGVSWSAFTHPSEQGLSSVWLSGPRDIYVLDAADRIYHSIDGKRWDLVYDDSDSVVLDLYQVRGSAADDIYVAGAPSLHFDGARWSLVDIGTATNSSQSVWVNNASDVYYLVYDDVYHFDGNGWSASHTAANTYMKRIWAASMSAIVVVGDGVFRYDGASWTSDIDRTTGNIYGVWGASATQVFGVGQAGRAIIFVP